MKRDSPQGISLRPRYCPPAGDRINSPSAASPFPSEPSHTLRRYSCQPRPLSQLCPNYSVFFLFVNTYLLFSSKQGCCLVQRCSGFMGSCIHMTEGFAQLMKRSMSLSLRPPRAVFFVPVLFRNLKMFAFPCFLKILMLIVFSFLPFHSFFSRCFADAFRSRMVIIEHIWRGFYLFFVHIHKNYRFFVVFGTGICYSCRSIAAKEGLR